MQRGVLMMPTTRHGRSAPEAIPSGGQEQRYSEDLAWTITGAAAIVACADGYAHPAERRSFLAYLRRCGCLTVNRHSNGALHGFWCTRTRLRRRRSLYDQRVPLLFGIELLRRLLPLTPAG